MTREEYYAGIEAYKNKLEHRAMDANAEDTSGKALENWKNQYLNQAINLRAKQYLASKSGRTDDASTYERQLQILLDKMTNLKGVSLSAKQALLQTIDQTATNKANVQFAKHSDESEDGVLEHGGEWKKHKYIRIENGRYIYPEDVKQVSKSSSSASSILNPGKGILQKVGQAIGEKVAGKVLGNSNASGAAINKAQADGAKRTADLQKSAYQKIQSAKDVAKQILENNQEATKQAEDLKKSKTKSDPNEAKEQSYDIDAKYHDYYAKRGRDAVQFFGSRASNKTEAVEGYEEAFERGKRMAEEGARDSAVSRAQASGMRRTNALKEGQAKNEENLAKKEAFTKETEDIAKANEERKERALNNNNQSVQTARSQSDESAAKAQKEGEAMQAWKDAQAQKALKEAAKKGEGESYEKAKAEGEAMQAWKNQKAWENSPKNPVNADKYYNKQMREVAEEELNTAIKLAKQYGNAEDAFKSGYLPWSDRQREISQELEKNLGHGIYGRDANQMLVEAFDKRKDSIDSDIRGIVEEIIKKEVERAKKDIGIDLAPKKLGTKVFEHSLNLTREEYYAGIEEYKRKKA